jgi:hypothetical protein
MISTDHSLSFFLVFACLSLIVTGCAPGNFILQKKDLIEINNNMDELEYRLDCLSSSMDSLLGNCNRQQELLTDNIKNNVCFFEQMERQINQKHDDMYKKLKALQQPKEPKPPAQPTFENKSTEKLLVGRIEKVRLTPPGRIFHARIDTGATTSSLDAREIETFERDSEDWVRFKIKDPKTNALYAIEKPIIRRVKILQASTNKADRRPVIRLHFQLGRISIIEEFTLEDRAHLDYQVLVGRNILQDLMVVDVAKKFINTLPKPETNKALTQ